MTSIRTQLRTAQRLYRSARYPGDLAAELLPRPSALARAATDRRWMIAPAVGAAAAAVLVLSLLLSRAGPTDPQPAPRPVDRAVADWLPIGPHRVPLPQFQPPALPLAPRELRLPMTVPPGVEKYQDLAMQYRQLQVPASLRHTTVPTIPADLPSRGVEWFQKVWTGDKSA